MKQGVFIVKNEKGMHMLSAGLLAKEANRFKSGIKVVNSGVEVNAKSIMGLLLLAAGQGSKLKVIANGPDEEAAVAALGRLISEGFGEK